MSFDITGVQLLGIGHRRIGLLVLSMKLCCSIDNIDWLALNILKDVLVRDRHSR